MTPIRISGKVLGQLAADFCPRCFWLRLHCQQRLPFQMFPGIFSSIDGFTKRVTAAHFAKHGRLPNWFEQFGDIKELVPVPHHSRFQFEDAKTGILLTGVPDELLRRGDESLVILDYKTARFTPNQDSLLPLYRVQLNSYAAIAEKIGMGKVTGLGLIYYEPQTVVTAADVDSVIQDNGFAMRFAAKVFPVALDMDSIPPLLARVRAIYDQPSAPEGRPDCKDCRLLNELLGKLTTPLTHNEREHLKWKLWKLRSKLHYSAFESGRFFQESQEHRIAAISASEAYESECAEQSRLLGEILHVERQLRGEGGGR